MMWKHEEQKKNILRPCFFGCCCFFFFFSVCGYVFCFFFFFQAEDGIRDDLVTGVQTCALPIFHVLHGEGIARCDDKTLPIKKGDSLLLHPGSEHVIENTGAGKLYTLTVMTPNEGFAELIRNGEPVEIETDDLRVLQGAG